MTGTDERWLLAREETAPDIGPSFEWYRELDEDVPADGYALQCGGAA